MSFPHEPRVRYGGFRRSVLHGLDSVAKILEKPPALARVTYDASDGYFYTALRFQGTVLPMVVLRIEFFLLMCLHFATLLMYRGGLLENARGSGVLGLEWHDIQVINAVMTFFLVFYNNQAFVRYCFLYNKAMKLLTVVSDTNIVWCLHLPLPQLDHFRLASRFLMLSVTLFFYENVVGLTDAGWREMMAHQLVTAEEREFLERFKARNRSSIVAQWSVAVSDSGLKLAGAKHNVMKMIEANVHACRGLQQDIAVTRALPMPFQYFHLLKAMILANLVFLAYRMGLTDSVWAPFVYFSAAAVLMGMMELTPHLSNPFGAGPMDFPIGKWLADAMEENAMMMETTLPGITDKFARAVEKEKAVPKQPQAPPRRYPHWEEPIGGKTSSCLDREATDGLESEFTPLLDEDHLASRRRVLLI